MMIVLRTTLAALLLAGLVAVSLACSPEQPTSPAIEVPATTGAAGTIVQEQDSPPVATPATDVPAQIAPTAAPTVATAAVPSAHTPPIATQVQMPPAPTDAATASPRGTAEPTAAAAVLPTNTPQPPPPASTLPPPTDSPTAAPLPTASRPAAPEGTNVGETPPAFAMNLADGTQVASADLGATGRPVFMHYFSTW